MSYQPVNPKAWDTNTKVGGTDYSMTPGQPGPYGAITPPGGGGPVDTTTGNSGAATWNLGGYWGNAPAGSGYADGGGYDLGYDPYDYTNSGQLASDSNSMWKSIYNKMPSGQGGMGSGFGNGMSIDPNTGQYNMFRDGPDNGMGPASVGGMGQRGGMNGGMGGFGGMFGGDSGPRDETYDRGPPADWSPAGRTGNDPYGGMSHNEYVDFLKNGGGETGGLDPNTDWQNSVLDLINAFNQSGGQQGTVPQNIGDMWQGIFREGEERPGRFWERGRGAQTLPYEPAMPWENI